MQIDLSGKTALVTGSTAGIGFAIAKGLAASGAEVVLNGRGQDRVDAALAKLKQAVPKAKLRGIAGDVGTVEGCNDLVTALPEVDILINNAGIYGAQDFFEISDEEWSRYYEINVMSGVRLARAYMQGMLKQNWGRIIFISSESALNIPTEMIQYGMTKTAQLAISRGLAKLTSGTGVTVNSVLPGPTMSEGGRFSSRISRVRTSSRKRRRRRTSSSSTGRARCCSASPIPTRSPAWWSMSRPRRPPPPTVRHYASKAASSTPSPERPGCGRAVSDGYPCWRLGRCARWPGPSFCGALQPDGPLHQRGQRIQMFGEPGKEFTFGWIAGEISELRTFSRVGQQLFVTSLHIHLG